MNNFLDDCTSLQGFSLVNRSILNLSPDQQFRAAVHFWAKVEKTDDCWIWKGALHGRLGYGGFHITFSKNLAKMIQSHRVAYELVKGRIPQGLTIDHLCRNPPCVNPDHLEAVTMRENQLRGNGMGRINSEKTRCPRGHPLVASNLDAYKLRLGFRVCLQCRKELKCLWDIRNIEHRKRYMKVWKSRRRLMV